MVFGPATRLGGAQFVYRGPAPVLIVLMLKILAAWTVCALLFIGLGAVILRRFGGSPRILYSFWIGFGAATAFLDTWNLFLPIHASAPLCLAVIALVGIVESRAPLRRELAGYPKMLGWPSLIWFGLIAFLALRVAGPPDHYDTGLYGAAAIRWITTYPTVPGLANLHARLGFNISLFPLAAAVQEGMSKSLGFRLLTGFALAALWSSIFSSCLRVIREKTADLPDWYFAILAIPAVYWAARARIVGIETDEPAAAACLLGAGLVLAEIVSSPPGQEFDAERRARTVAWATLLALAVSLKESTAVFAALTWAIGFLLTPWPKKRFEKIALSAIPAGLILIPWLIRGILLSGYPFFPNPAFGIRATWTVPRVVASFYVAWTRAYARIPDVPIASTLGAAWLHPWLHVAAHDRGGLQTPALISAVGACVVCALWRNLGRTRVRAAWILAASLPGIVFWFLEIPDPRFGEAAIWATAAVLGAMGIVSARMKFRRLRPSLVMAGLFALTLWCVFSFDWQVSYRPSLSVRSLNPLPVPKLISRRTQSGLVVFLPARGYQCWDAELPCTPYFNRTLRLRVPGNMRWGFASQGMPNLPAH